MLQAEGGDRGGVGKTVSVSVGVSEGVLLTAPIDVPITKLDAVVRDRASWIVSKLRRLDEQTRATAVREWVSGETILYLGRHFRLRIVRKAKPENASLKRGRLVVEIHRDLEPQERPQAVCASVEAWYREHAEIWLAERVKLLATEIRVAVPTIVVPIQAPTKRWGSCDKQGTLRFSWRAIQAPIRLVDYVVARELTHLLHREHTEAFWSCLEDVMPDYEVRREALRRMGPEMEW